MSINNYIATASLVAMIGGLGGAVYFGKQQDVLLSKILRYLNIKVFKQVNKYTNNTVNENNYLIFNKNYFYSMISINLILSIIIIFLIQLILYLKNDLYQLLLLYLKLCLSVSFLFLFINIIFIFN